mmetsp:Transcript_28061/g.59415  ORF Transcript_28061/g.59415 Transcript_28061/m.59415 type:complete len:91 (+) Transcript_28061:759-1031(+)
MRHGLANSEVQRSRVSKGALGQADAPLPFSVPCGATAGCPLARCGGRGRPAVAAVDVLRAEAEPVAPLGCRPELVAACPPVLRSSGHSCN